MRSHLPIRPATAPDSPRTIITCSHHSCYGYAGDWPCKGKVTACVLCSECNDRSNPYTADGGLVHSSRAALDEVCLVKRSLWTVSPSFRDRRRGEAIAAAPAFQELRVLEQQLIEVNVAFGEADEKSCDQMSGCQIRSCVPRHFLSPIFTLTAIGTCGRALRQERRSRLLPTSWSKRHAAICYPSVFSRRSNPSESASSRALYKYNAQLSIRKQL